MNRFSLIAAVSTLLLVQGCASTPVATGNEPTSIIGIGDCEKYVSILLVDAQGVVHPFDAKDLDLEKVKAAADKLGKGHVLVVKVCKEGVST